MNFNCICCSKEIVEIYPDVNTKPECGSFNGGNVTDIHGGYGSEFDEQSFWIAICDDCTKEKLESGLIKPIPSIGIEIFVYEINILKDGGTIVIDTSIGEICIDHRIGTKTKGRMYKGKPGKHDSELLDAREEVDLGWKLAEPLKKYANNRDAQYRELARKLIIDFILP